MLNDTAREAIKIYEDSANVHSETNFVALMKAFAVYERVFLHQEEAIKKELAAWIDGNIGRSSEAIYLYMTLGTIPAPFDAPSDESDRKRCVVLLKAVPEWVPRLSEIEQLQLRGTSNGKEVFPWNEQIPLIINSLT